MYGANLSNMLSANKNAFLDILAWVPYGIMHFAGPIITATVLFIFGAPGTVSVFSHSFGYMNLIGVAIQLMFPCAPPCKFACYCLMHAPFAMLTFGI